MSNPPAPVTDDRIEAEIFRLLDTRASGKTICPSEVARSLCGDATADDEAAWRALMPDVRAVAQRLVREKRLRVTQRGAEVDAVTQPGPIRLGRPR